MAPPSVTAAAHDAAAIATASAAGGFSAIASASAFPGRFSSLDLPFLSAPAPTWFGFRLHCAEFGQTREQHQRNDNQGHLRAEHSEQTIHKNPPTMMFRREAVSR
jgi:hypothetical protein